MGPSPSTRIDSFAVKLRTVNSSGEGRLGFFDNDGKRVFVVYSQISQHATVQTDFGFTQTCDQSAVAQTTRT